MATPAYSRPAYSSLDSAAVIALVVRKSAQIRSERWPFVKDISRLLFDLRERGFRFRNLGLRRIPGGYYSEDVETFVGQLLSMGYATQRSPIRLEEKGEKLCEEIIAAEGEVKREELTKLETALAELLPSRSPVIS